MTTDLSGYCQDPVDQNLYSFGQMESESFPERVLVLTRSSPGIGCFSSVYLAITGTPRRDNVVGLVGLLWAMQGRPSG